MGQEEKPEAGESVEDEPTPYPAENARHDYTVDNGNPQGLKLTVGIADKPVQKESLSYLILLGIDSIAAALHG